MNFEVNNGDRILVLFFVAMIFVFGFIIHYDASDNEPESVDRCVETSDVVP